MFYPLASQTNMGGSGGEVRKVWRMSIPSGNLLPWEVKWGHRCPRLAAISRKSGIRKKQHQNICITRKKHLTHTRRFYTGLVKLPWIFGSHTLEDTEGVVTPKSRHPQFYVILLNCDINFAV